MSNLTEKLIEKIALQELVNSFKAGDTLVLDDDVLRAAVQRTHPLNRSELAALMNSPLTLRRLQVITAQLKQRAAAPQAANDTYWSGSRCLLRAAAGEQKTISFVTADDMWSLTFLYMGDGYQMVLRVNAESPRAQFLIDTGAEVTVLDGQKRCVLTGSLDDDGELEADWISTISPAAYFAESGGVIHVVPA